MTPAVRELAAADWPAVEAIYGAGIATGNATFETATPSWERWDAGHRPDLRFVAELDGAVAGWVAASAVSARPCYAGVIEHSVYVAPERQGNGVGGTLLRHLLAAAGRAGVWTIQTSIFPENAASLALHRACGFRVVGHRERIARMHGRWRDTLFLERRRPD